MTWQQYTYLAFAILAIIATIAGIGRPRDPITPGLAIATIIIQGLMAWMILSI